MAIDTTQVNSTSPVTYSREDARGALVWLKEHALAAQKRIVAGEPVYGDEFLVRMAQFYGKTGFLTPKQINIVLEKMVDEAEAASNQAEFLALFGEEVAN